MNIWVKCLLIIGQLWAFVGLIFFWIDTFLRGQYYESASYFLTSLGFLFPILLSSLLVFGITCTIKYTK